MVERVVVQTQSEYASMNRSFIKWAFIVGGAIFGFMVLSGDTGWGEIPKIFGVIGFVPLGLWIIRKIMKRKQSYHNRYNSRWENHRHKRHWRSNENGIGDSRLFWAEIFIVIGAFLFSVSLINFIKLDIMWLLVGVVLIIIGSALKSVKK